MSSKNRKVYQIGDRSIREFFSSPTRYLAEATSRESEFEKPYLDDDRGKMHSDPSWPDWPPLPIIPDWPPWIPSDGPIKDLPGCAILCYEPLDCDEPIWCHPGIWCGTDLGCTLCSWVVEGATAGYTPHLSGVGSWGIDVWIDSELVEEDGKALITICMTDPCGNVCCHDSEVTCKVCPADISMTWASASDLTVARNNSVLVSVANGLGPYTWSVAGTGFSMRYEETSGVTNYVEADNTACGMATVTVTDFCEDSVTGYVRCDEGQWIEDCSSVTGGNCDRGQADDYHYVDNKRITIVNRCLYSGAAVCLFESCGGYDSADYIPSDAYCWPVYQDIDTCPDALEGRLYTCVLGETNECCTLSLGIYVHEWTC